MSDITLEQIKSEIEEFGSDNLAVCGGTYVGGIYSQQLPDEIAPLIYDLHNWGSDLFLTKSILEIGSASGAVPYIFNHFLNLEHLTIVDDNRHKNHIHRKKILGKIDHVEFIGDSHSGEALKFVENQGINYDIIFIDGDHSYKGVKKDTEMYYQFSEYLGYIIYHDIVACNGVKKFVAELCTSNEFDMKLVKMYVSKEYPKPLGIALFRSHNWPMQRSPK